MYDIYYLKWYYFDEQEENAKNKVTEAEIYVNDEIDGMVDDVNSKMNQTIAKSNKTEDNIRTAIETNRSQAVAEVQRTIANTRADAIGGIEKTHNSLAADISAIPAKMNAAYDKSVPGDLAEISPSFAATECFKKNIVARNTLSRVSIPKTCTFRKSTSRRDVLRKWQFPSGRALFFLVFVPKPTS